MKHDKNRRQFLKQASLAGLGFWVAGGLKAADSKSPNEKLNLSQLWTGIEIFGRFFELFARKGAKRSTLRPARSA